MSTFNPGANIHVIRDDDEVKVRFDGDTFAVSATTNGFVLNNDWNNRHFTMAFDQNSILYHLTREDINDRKSGKKALAPSEFVAEFYGYIRSLAPPVPKERIPLDFVGRAEFDEMKAYMREEGVVQDTTTGLTVDVDKRNSLEERLNSNPVELGALYQRVLEPVDFEDAVDPESGDHIYFYPTTFAVLILFPFPDGYVGVTTVQEVLNFAEIAGGSQIFDHVIRSMSD